MSSDIGKPAESTTDNRLFVGLVVLTFAAIIAANVRSGYWMRLAGKQSARQRAMEVVDPVRAPGTWSERVGRTVEAGKALARGQWPGDPEIHRLEKYVRIWTWAAWTAVGVFFVVAGLFMARVWRRRMSDDPRRLPLQGIRLAVLCLLAGLLSPMMSVVVYQQVPVLGRIVLDHKSKGIITAALALLSSGGFLLGLLILLFSVAIPAAKTVVMWNVLRGACTPRAVRVVQALGRWSMADVFVVAMLMTFLAMKGEPKSSVQPEPGLFFFAAYVILSMAVAHFDARRPGREP